jgi:hypothetical protein
VILLEQSRPFAAGIGDRRLGIEVAVIQRLAEDLTRRLQGRDPLSEQVHHTRYEAFGIALTSGTHYLFGRSIKTPSFRAARDWHETAHGS